MEPTTDQLKQQIRKSIDGYNETDPKAAMLSGMNLVATFLAKLDGSRIMTASVVKRAVEDVAAERGMIIGKR